MRRRQAGNYKGKAVYIVGGLALCSIVGMLGLYMYQSNQSPSKPDVVDLNEVADAQDNTTAEPNTDDTKKNETTESTDTSSSLSTDQKKEDETKKTPDTTKSSDMDTSEEPTNTETKPEETTPETTEQENTAPATQETSASATSVSFSENESLSWPVSGNVLMNYSMDATIYFATLDQYKYNPAIVIQSSVNTNVLSATDGIVESIANNEETGLTMTVNLGNGYKAVYGQLKESQVNEGDYVKKGAILGFVNEPTKYYSTEGTNLYFEMLKDDQPINPTDFLE